MSSNLFTPSLRYTNKETCNSAWTFIDGQNVSDIEVPKFIKNLFTSFDDSRYGKMGKDLIEGAACGENEYVSSNTCTPCPAGTTNPSGDESDGADTQCTATICAENEYVSSNTCTPCPTGTSNGAGDDASGVNTECSTTCAENEYVSSNTCTPCPAGTTNPSGDESDGEDTQCTATICDENEYVSSNTCTPCPTGTSNGAGDDASGVNTECTPINICSQSDISVDFTNPTNCNNYWLGDTLTGIGYGGEYDLFYTTATPGSSDTCRDEDTCFKKCCNGIPQTEIDTDNMNYFTWIMYSSGMWQVSS